MYKKFDPADLVLIDEFPREQILRWFPKRPTVKILIVADTSVSFTSSFGIGKVIDLIRDNADGYVKFEVDLARLGTKSSTLSVAASPGPKQAKFTNFRFKSQVNGDHILDGYDEVWCFGFAPGNDGSTNDDNIWNDAYASDDDDLEVLTKWMNAGGGVLAMGDHHYLGASMCARIPRVGTMRRWTNLQDVPPIDGTDRFDTNQPNDPSQDPALFASPAVIPGDVQRDDVPQPIEWRRYPLQSLFFFEKRYRPHPLLCGGDLGVIDVLPDHPHEGWVYEDADIKDDKTYTFNTFSGDEYPSAGPVQPMPEAIAWANTLPDPPYNHDKGASPYKRFAVIGAYDGDPVEVGRVVVDSTWHHWMDMNIEGLEAESPDTEYQKIVRYFRNCAVWLAREGQRKKMLTYSAFWSTLTAVSYEEFGYRQPIFTLGGKAIDVIGQSTSECLVRDWLDIFLPIELIEIWRTKIPIPDPCWSCPPIDLMHRAIMGGIMQELVELSGKFQTLRTDPKAELALTEEHFDKAVRLGVRTGVAAFMKSVRENLSELERVAELGGRKAT